jgi:hypothetical protein
MFDERNNPAAEDEMDSSEMRSDAEADLPGSTTVDEAVERYSHCHACGANLHFSHVTDFIRNLTQETARCPECGDKSRRVIHRLQ